MGKDKKNQGQDLASAIFKKRDEFVEAHKVEEFIVPTVEIEKKLISTDNFSSQTMSEETNEMLGLEKSKVIPTAVKADIKYKALTQKEKDEAQQLENEKIDIMAGLMTMGGNKPSLIKKEEPVVVPVVEEKEEEIDYSYDVTSQFYTKPIKPIDKSPKK